IRHGSKLIGFVPGIRLRLVVELRRLVLIERLGRRCSGGLAAQWGPGVSGRDHRLNSSKSPPISKLSGSLMGLLQPRLEPCRRFLGCPSNSAAAAASGEDLTFSTRSRVAISRPRPCDNSLPSRERAILLR